MRSSRSSSSRPSTTSRSAPPPAASAPAASQLDGLDDELDELDDDQTPTVDWATLDVLGELEPDELVENDQPHETTEDTPSGPAVVERAPEGDLRASQPSRPHGAASTPAAAPEAAQERLTEPATDGLPRPRRAVAAPGPSWPPPLVAPMTNELAGAVPPEETGASAELDLDRPPAPVTPRPAARTGRGPTRRAWAGVAAVPVWALALGVLAAVTAVLLAGNLLAQPRQATSTSTVAAPTPPSSSRIISTTAASRDGARKQTATPKRAASKAPNSPRRKRSSARRPSARPASSATSTSRRPMTAVPSPSRAAAAPRPPVAAPTRSVPRPVTPARPVSQSAATPSSSSPVPQYHPAGGRSYDQVRLP